MNLNDPFQIKFEYVYILIQIIIQIFYTLSMPYVKKMQLFPQEGLIVKRLILVLLLCYYWCICYIFKILF